MALLFVDRYNPAVKNPARELGQLLDAWNEPGGKTHLGRREAVADERDSTFWGDHQRAVDLISEIGSRLDLLQAEGHNVDAQRRSLREYYRSVFLTGSELKWNATFSSGVPVECISDTARDMLRSIETLLDVQGGQYLPPAPVLANLEAAITAAEEFVKSAEDINESMRLHLLGLLAAIREAVTNGDRSAATAATTEFVGNVNILSETTKNKRWHEVGRDFLVNWSAGLAVNGTWALGNALLTAQGAAN
jgi:hypothetical protein